MAITDLETGKIIGCKKGTITWWHEKAHLLYNRSEKGMTINFWSQSCLVMTIVYLTIHAFWDIIFWALAAGVSCAIFLGLYIYEEVWCWNYANKKVNGDKKK